MDVIAAAPANRTLPRLSPPQAEGGERPDEAAVQGEEIPDYTGPTDGGSHYDPKAARWLRPGNKFLMSLLVRKHVAGLENIPQSGSHILCVAPHQSYLDPPLAVSISDLDWRFMAAKEQFTGPIGVAMTKMGAFPVDRGSHSAKPIEVGIKLLNNEEGAKFRGMGIFAEGRIRTDGQVHDLQPGMALIALMSKCETIVPAVLHYTPREATFSSKLLNYAAASAVAAGSLAVATHAGFWPNLALGIVSGAVSGAMIGGGVAMARAGSDLRKEARAALKFGSRGALVGALAGGLGMGFFPGHALAMAAPLSLGPSLATLAAGKYLSGRDDVALVVGTPIEVAPFREIADKKAARKALIDRVHDDLVKLNAPLLEN